MAWPTAPKIATATSAGRTDDLNNSDIRIAMCFFGTARMGDRAVAGRPYRLCVFPDRARLIVGRARLPGLRPRCQFGLGQIDRDRAFGCIDRDHIAVFQEPDRAANGSFGPDMADAETARRARKTTVGDEGDLAAHALAVERRSRRQHLPHARAAARTFVT